MAHLKTRGNIIWVKHYDILAGTYKEFSTKIRENKDGFTEARKILKQLEAKVELNENFTELIPSLKFTKGYVEYIESRKFKKRTKEISSRIKDIVLEIGEDKNISTYCNTDYKKLLNLFSKKNYKNNTQAIYTSHLHAMFEFF